MESSWKVQRKLPRAHELHHHQMRIRGRYGAERRGWYPTIHFAGHFAGTAALTRSVTKTCPKRDRWVATCRPGTPLPDKWYDCADLAKKLRYLSPAPAAKEAAREGGNRGFGLLNRQGRGIGVPASQSRSATRAVGTSKTTTPPPATSGRDENDRIWRYTCPELPIILADAVTFLLSSLPVVSYAQKSSFDAAGAVCRWRRLRSLYSRD